MFLAFTLLAAGFIPTPAPVTRNAATFTNSDTRALAGQVVYLRGYVAELGGVDNLYVLHFDGDGPNTYQWSAIVSRDEWREAEQGRQVVVLGLLRVTGDGRAIIVAE